MVSISGNNVAITRGDAVTLNLTITDYDFSGDTVTFAMKRDYRDTDAVLTKTFENGAIELTAEETASLEPGRYVYDVKLVGEEITQTVIAGAAFIVGQSVFA